MRALFGLLVHSVIALIVAISVLCYGALLVLVQLCVALAAIWGGR